MKHLIIALILLPIPSFAEIPMIENSTAKQGANGWSFTVTLRHPDSGWDHYADGWRVEDAQGNILGYRELFHPHVNEQPFTRALSGVDIPAGTTEVFIRARCSVDGWGDMRFKLGLGK